MFAKPKLLAVGLVLVALALAAAAWIWLTPERVAERPDAVSPALQAGAGSLDGMTFLADIGPVGRSPDVKDRLAFAEGRFLSLECERNCDYPASAYFVREVEGATAFVSETRCPFKDAKIVWRGRVKDGQIEGIATWTVRRWYWTIEKDLAFTGRLVASDSPLAHAD